MGRQFVGILTVGVGIGVWSCGAYDNAPAESDESGGSAGWASGTGGSVSGSGGSQVGSGGDFGSGGDQGIGGDAGSAGDPGVGGDQGTGGDGTGGDQGTGGDGSAWSTGSFFEGAITSGCSDDAAVDDAIQACAALWPALSDYLFTRSRLSVPRSQGSTTTVLVPRQ